MARLRYNGLATGAAGSIVSLTLGGSLTNSATSITFSAALTHSNGTAVPTITGTDYIPLEILDASGHLTEIVYLTAYTAAATTGTISRGKEGTSGVAHSSGDKVVHGSTLVDVSGTRLSDVLGASDFTSTTNNAYTTVTGLTFSFTPAVDGVLMMHSRVRAKISVLGDCYMRATISPAPTVAPADIGSSFESMTANKLRTFPLVGSWDVVGGTAYTVTVTFFQTGGGTYTADKTTSETELAGVFIAL